MLSERQLERLRRELVPKERLPLVFDALGDPGRFLIFRLLASHHDVCVSDVARVLGVSVPAASQQLRILERVGLVRKIRQGQMICYEVREEDHLVRRIIKLIS